MGGQHLQTLEDTERQKELHRMMLSIFWNKENSINVCLEAEPVVLLFAKGDSCCCAQAKAEDGLGSLNSRLPAEQPTSSLPGSPPGEGSQSRVALLTRCSKRRLWPCTCILGPAQGEGVLFESGCMAHLMVPSAMAPSSRAPKPAGQKLEKGQPHPAQGAEPMGWAMLRGQAGRWGRRWFLSHGWALKEGKQPER